MSVRDQGRGRAWSAGTDQCQQPHSSTWTVCVCRRRWRHHLKQPATVRLQLFTLALTNVVRGCMPGHGGGAVRQQLHRRALGAWGGGRGESRTAGLRMWASWDSRSPSDAANGVLLGSPPPAVVS